MLHKHGGDRWQREGQTEEARENTEGRRKDGVKTEAAVEEKEKEGEREERGGDRQRKIEMCKQERNKGVEERKEGRREKE